jgi:hypothetical protein
MARWLATFVSLAGALLVLASPAAAQPVTGHATNDDFLGIVIVGAVAEGRIGDRSEPVDFELSLGQRFPIQTGQFDWVSGETYDWTFSYEPGSIGGAARFHFEGTELLMFNVTNFNSFFVRTNAERPNTRILVNDLVLGPPPSAGGGGLTIFETAMPQTPASSTADGNGAVLDVLKISGVDLLVGFTLQGQVTAFFDGADPTPIGSELGFRVYGARADDFPDADGDGVEDSSDNCPNDANADQADDDSDNLGDVCDNCPFNANGPSEANIPGVGNQTDSDGDDAGDACDNCPIDCTPVLRPLDNCKNAPEVLVPGELPVQPDDDGDGVGNKCDNCRTVENPGQEDDNGDGLGDVCEPTIVSLFSGGTSTVSGGLTAASIFTLAAAVPVELQLRLFCGPRNIAFANIGILLPESPQGSSQFFDNFGGCTDTTGSLDDPTQQNCTFANAGTGLGETVSTTSSTLGPEIASPGISGRFLALRLQGNLDRGFANPLLCEAFDPTDLTTKTNVELGVLRLMDLPPDSAPQLSEDGLAALGLELLIDATNTPVAAAEIESSVDVSGADPVEVTMSVNPNFDDGGDGRRFAVVMEVSQDSAPLELSGMVFGLRGPVGILPGEMTFGGCNGGPVAVDGIPLNTCTAGNADLGPYVAGSGSAPGLGTFTLSPNHGDKPADVPADTLMVALQGGYENIFGDKILNDGENPVILGVVEYLIDPEAPPQDPPSVDFQGATALPGVTATIQPLDGAVSANQVARVSGGNADLDSDSDNRGDNADNCPNFSNPDQFNRGGLRFVGPGDFIGDLCTCGDSSGDGVIDDASEELTNQNDVEDCQALLAQSATSEDAQRCSVNSGAATPTIIDIVVLELDLDQPDSAGATIEQACVPAN